MQIGVHKKSVRSTIVYVALSIFFATCLYLVSQSQAQAFSEPSWIDGSPVLTVVPTISIGYLALFSHTWLSWVCKF